MVGARYDNEVPATEADVLVLDPSAQITQGLPTRWTRTDAWYNFESNPRAAVRVLARLDETTYAGGTMGDDHPIAWYHAYDGGRAWYTAGGHTPETYAEPLFLEHLLGGIRYAAGLVPSAGGLGVGPIVLRHPGPCAHSHDVWGRPLE
jgi:hypothetical protein